MDPAASPTVRLPRSNLEQLSPAETNALRRQLDGHAMSESVWWHLYCDNPNDTAFGRARCARRADRAVAS